MRRFALRLLSAAGQSLAPAGSTYGYDVVVHIGWWRQESRATSREIHAALAVGFENGTLRPIVGQEFPLAEAPQAHEAVMEPGAYGKIVLLP